MHGAVTGPRLLLFLCGCLVDVQYHGTQAACDFQSYTEYKDEFRYRHPQESGRMYPFGTDFCDQNADDQGKNMGFDPGIDFTLPFYGAVHLSAFVSPHGHMTLHRTQTPTQLPYFFMEEWPNQNYPLNDAPDPAFIGPFYSEADYRWGSPGETGISYLFYRVLSPERAGLPSNERDVTLGMLEEISQDVRRAVVGASKFSATHGLVITWYQVTFHGGDCQGDCVRNTFQTAVVTDEVDTFAVFNFYDINWVGGASLGNHQKCDVYSGTTTPSRPECSPAHVGFNAGEARGFTKLPYSNTDKVKDIDDNGGSDVPGRFIYYISGDRIVRGGCSNDTSLSSVAWPLEIYPRHGNMFGGNEVHMSSTCFLQPSVTQCRFGNIAFPAKYDGNIMQVRCVSPMQDKVGVLKASASGDGGSTFNRETDYAVGLVDHVEPGVTITNFEVDWLNPGVLHLTWDPYDLAGETEIGEPIDVRLYGYREYETSGHMEKSWDDLEAFVTGDVNDGVYDVYTGDFHCTGSNCHHYIQGAIQVSLSMSSMANRRAVWTEIIPLGWYIKNNLEDLHGGGWAGYLCREWDSRDSKDSTWRDSLQPCPCTLQQAYSDFGRFQADASCRSGTCGIHVGALHCVVATGATTSSGAGTRCCYDDSDQLMYAGDTQYGSFSERSHSWGSHPYATPSTVPTLSHWVNDLAPYYVCCVWQDNLDDCFNRYMRRRPTTECKYYQSSGHAIAFGDPHFKTLDETLYMFNGLGEFWLLQVTDAVVEGTAVDFKLQARFQQVEPMGYGEIKATAITAIVMQQSAMQQDGHIVSIELNDYSPYKKLSVNVDGTLLEFDHDSLKWQVYRDFTIINNNPAGDVSCSNFTVVYNMGVGVQAIYAHGLMQVTASIPPAFYRETLGLFGLWNGDPSDDLKPREPTAPPVPAENTSSVHYDFGMTWEVTSSESRFTHLYRAKLNYDYYRDPDFLPHFYPVIPSNASLTEGQVNQVCGGDDPCTYDYMMTVSEGVAVDALDIQEWYEQMRDMATLVISCGHLNIPDAVKCEPISYLINTTTEICGCREGYSLSGPTHYYCQDAGDGTAYWTPDVTTKCQAGGGGLSTAGAIALGVSGFILLVLIIIGIVVLWLVYRRRKKEKEAANKTYPDDGTTEEVMFTDNPPDVLATKPPTPPPPPPPEPRPAEPAYKKPPKPSTRPPRAPLRLTDDIDISASKATSDPVRAPSSEDIAMGHRAETPSVHSWDDAEITPPSDRRDTSEQQVNFYPNPNYTSMTSSEGTDPNMTLTSKDKRPPPYTYTNYSRDVPDAGAAYPVNKKRSKKAKKPKAIHHVHQPQNDHSVTLSSDPDTSKGDVSQYYKQKYQNRYKGYSYA